MTTLPQFVRRLPYVFYALAIMLGAWRFYTDWTMAELTFQYGDGGGIENLTRLTALYSAFTEAAYMLANGAIIHVLVAIHDKVRGT